MVSKYPGETSTCIGAITDSPGFILYPSARMTFLSKLPPNGIPVVAPAERTPGMERRVSNARVMNGRHFSDGYFTCGRAVEIVITLSLLKPGSTARSLRKLANNNPDPMSNTHAR